MPRSSRVLIDPNPQSDLVQFKYLRQYGVGRTKAFEKSTVGHPGFDPKFPKPLLINGTWYLVRTEIRDWALTHRGSPRRRNQG